MSAPYLFVGGPAHGEVHHVYDELSVFIMVEPAISAFARRDDDIVVPRRIAYRAERFAVGGVFVVRLFVDSSLTTKEATVLAVPLLLSPNALMSGVRIR